MLFNLLVPLVPFEPDLLEYLSIPSTKLLSPKQTKSIVRYLRIFEEENLRYPQHTSHTRRLYIGHLSAYLSEQDVHHYFGKCVISTTVLSS